MKNAVTKIKNALQVINSRVDEAEDSTRNLEDKERENIQTEEQNKTKQKKQLLESGATKFWWHDLPLTTSLAVLLGSYYLL